MHALADLFNFQPPNLGYELDSTVLGAGLHTIALRFFDGAGQKLQPDLVSAPLTILVDNQNCVAALQLPTLSTGASANACGLLKYGTDTALSVSLPYAVSQPNGHATFSVALARGVTNLGASTTTPPLPSNAPLSQASSPLTATVATLLGDSCTIAGFAVEVYVAASMTNGFSRQSQYDAEALEGFVLAP